MSDSKQPNLWYDLFLSYFVRLSHCKHIASYYVAPFFRVGPPLKRSINTCSNTSNEGDWIDGHKGTNVNITSGDETKAPED
ncbi:hypothetical protein BpHYR1_010938 [Brachionus plicatilis]|uniref:Uncharacterized protein n=1 Tax=Brachionus plicatilis TaxID=10195 RepID=A0A3M7P6R6_BRAPC|nr:hypothetical protein BpHYR1_010938 [Brachionus plicatilis]